jgi:UDP-N-acetylmuramate: L-alanyl-gamma-D-glutamyl-meso-diaminopimelate ligase
MHIHLIAICGSGMGSLAQMLKAAGHKVTGSDANIYPPMSIQLESAGIVCKQGFSAQNIDCDTDLVVVGNAVSSTNVEVQEVLKRSVPYLSFPEALARYFLKDRSPIVVVGTHGKTTTSALMAWILESAGRDPGFMIGGWAKNFKGGAKIGNGPYFVVEGDEYDTAFFDKGPKFLHYQPRWAILTSIEFDHGDIYKDMDHLKAAFRAFVKLLPPNGMLVAANGFSDVDEIIQDLACPVIRYSLESGDKMEWQARAIHPNSSGVQFEAVYQGSPFAWVDSPLLGRHNVQNVLAVMAMAYQLGLSREEILHGIATFQGVKRRQEVVGVVNDIMIMDDFAHHPTAIHETLAGIRASFPGRRLWAVFEPRSATSRRKVFQEAFAQAFQKADEVIIADLYAPEKIQPQERLDPTRLVRDIQKQGQKARFISSADEIVKDLASHLRSGDIICIMSSGGFGGIHSKLISALQDEVKS